MKKKGPRVLAAATALSFIFFALTLNAVSLAADEPSLTPGELRAMLERGESVTIVDVRTPGEYEEGHIPGSISVPLGTIKDLDALPGEGRVVLYCSTGARSGRAMEILAGKGISGAINLSGGIEAWAKTGGEVVKGGEGPETEEDIYFSGYPKNFTVPKGVCEQKPPSMKFGE